MQTGRLPAYTQKGVVGDFHNHNFNSNSLQSDRFSIDSNLTYRQQLEACLLNGIDFIFITNHDTVKGYKDFLTERDSFEKFKHIQVYLGEEMSATGLDGRTAHIVGLGISEKIDARLSLEETIDRIHSQGGVCFMPHPFGVESSAGYIPESCDLVEGFNSNNIDEWSNVSAIHRGHGMGKPLIAGSDAHVFRSIGKSKTLVNAENNLDSILKSLKRADFEVLNARYNPFEVFEEIVVENFRNNRDTLLADIDKKHGPRAHTVASAGIKIFMHTPGYLWKAPAKIFIRHLKNLSYKTEVLGYERSIYKAPWKEKILESFKPVDGSRMGNYLDARIYKDFGRSESSRVNMINELNVNLGRCAVNILKRNPYNREM